MGGVALWPAQASAEAPRVDAIFSLLLVVSAVIVLLVAGLLLGFAIRYRRGSKAPRGRLPAILSRDIEIGWTSATAFLALFLFWWAGAAQLAAVQPPPQALEIRVIGRQWMWEVRHPSGARELDELHVPLGEPVRLVMSAEDVIHSFFVPAFRLKQDVVPGRLTEAWFTATQPGEYHLFCAEFCGTEHSAMRGRVVVLPPEDYARWSHAQPEGDNLAQQGAKAFVALGCAGCHVAGGPVHAPGLVGLYGRQVALADGRRVVADEAYLRDSILLPGQDVVAGYDPVMPSFAGVASEAELQRVVAYLMSLREDATP